MSHTPGPWTYQVLDRDDGTSFMVSTVEDDPAKWQAVAECSFDAPKANARLIAAAPDLLAALEDIKKLATEAGIDYDPFEEIAAAAIAKARG